MRFYLVGIVVALLASTSVLAQAQKKAPADDNAAVIEFDTTDEARLVGTFYRGLKGTDSPCAILVHRFKSDRTKGGWDALARELQTKLGFAVLTFDFRGHGGSTRIKDRFWNYEHNKGGLRGGASLRGKGQITVNDFKGNYWPVLINDIAAARHFLELQNDASRCNASSIVVIGAEDGAGLAMAWMAHEVDRRVIPTGTIFIAPNARTPGEDLAAGVWLGPVTRSQTSGTSFRVTDWFGRASGLRSQTPMFFIYGKQDQASAAVVPNMLNVIRRNPENIRSKHSYDREEGLATRLPGQDLIGPTAANLGVTKKILDYLEQVMTNHRRNVVWREMKPTPPPLFPLASYGFNPPG